MPEFVVPGGVLDHDVLDQIGAYMVWPDGVKGAETGRRYVRIKKTIEALRKGSLSISTNEQADTIEQAMLIPNTIQQDRADQIDHGMFAGVILEKLLYPAYSGGNPRTHSAVLKELTDQDYNRIGPKNQTEGWAKFFKERKFMRSSLQTAWYDYRSVSHLYVAFFYTVQVDAPVFPCRLQQLPSFLAFAEDARRVGESWKLGKKTVLVPGSTWSVPSSVDLPPVHD